MCCLGSFIRETDTGVVPLFAWRAWTVFRELPESEPVSEAAWHPKRPTGPALTGILNSLGATRLPSPPASPPGTTVLQMATPPDGEVVGHLRSFNGSIWIPNQAFRAGCDIHGAHATIPNQECSCGVYALRRRGDLGNLQFSDLVTGIVALWGTVLEYEIGYRAEMAYPAALILPNLDRAGRESVERCARLYRVPVFGTPDQDRGDALIPALR
jgi:hypothetical protein